MVKLQIADEHCEYFSQQKKIEFENLIPYEQLVPLNTLLGSALNKRLKLDANNLNKQSTQVLFEAGRDLWREDAALKKIVCNRWWAEIASQLTRSKPIRLAYDQFLLKGSAPIQKILSKKTEKEDAFEILLANPQPIDQISSFQGLLCGLLICLRNDCQEEMPSSTALDGLYPVIPGNGVFFDPSTTLDFNHVLNSDKKRYLLVLFSTAKTVYVYNPKDSHTHSMKSMGYVFGDKVKDSTHPILYR